jgi:hypothetical protein
MGCDACDGQSADRAWEAIRDTPIGVELIDESHYGVQLRQHACGQRFVVIFTERIDWVNGDDPQELRAVPISEDEFRTLAAQGDQVSTAALEALGAERRYLINSWPADAGKASWWRTGGLWIGPHD